MPCFTLLFYDAIPRWFAGLFLIIFFFAHFCQGQSPPSRKTRKTHKTFLRWWGWTGIIISKDPRLLFRAKKGAAFMKSKIFSIVGLVMGCISVSISVTALVFSAIGMAKTKGIKKPLSFWAVMWFTGIDEGDRTICPVPFSLSGGEFFLFLFL